MVLSIFRNEGKLNGKGGLSSLSDEGAGRGYSFYAQKRDAFFRKMQQWP